MPFLALAWLAACSGGPPAREAPLAGAAAQPLPALPSAGPVVLALPPSDGSAYRVVASLEGESEVQPISESPSGAWRRERSSSDIELVYHAVAAPRAPEGEIGAVLVLDALRHRTVQRGHDGPLVRAELELAEDRLRIAQDDKVTTDLRGAQPREDITPRLLLDRPFALLRQDLEGHVITVALQGLPPAKRFLRPLELPPVIEVSRLPRPTQPIAPGATWSGRIFPLGPAGRLALRVDATWELAGFERIDGHACAWIVLRGQREGADLLGETGIPFERVAARISGQAWVELGTARVRRYVVEEDVRASYERSASQGRGTRHRARHRARLVLELLDPRPESRNGTWADGTERFRRL